MHLKKGFRLNNGKYEILEVLGQGGFGITYNAEGKTSLQGELGSIEVTAHVAIKEFFFKDYCERDSNSMRVTISSTTGKELFQRFKEKLVKEAIILSKLNHPNIIRVIEIFEENNTAYMVMEFVEGNSLLDKLNEQGTIPVCQSIDYTSQIGVALSYVHTQNILHLDVKPSNILIRKKDDRALLIDFGVSKRYSPEHKETSMTPVGRSKGYAPPEQYIDKGTALFAPSLDVYSLGATLYHCITGVIPPEPYEILEYGLALPSELNTALSGNFEQAILKAMALKKADRFQTVQEFIQAIKYTEKSQQEPSPIKSAEVILSEPNYGGETIPVSDEPSQILPGPVTPIETPEIKPPVADYACETIPIIEKPGSTPSASSGEPEKPKETPPQSFSGESEPDKEPKDPQPADPPIEPGYPIKKPDTGHPWLRWVIGITVFLGFILGLMWLVNHGPTAKELEGRHIADSIHVADSLAIVHAEQQRTSDSIGNENEKQKINDSINSLLKEKGIHQQNIVGELIDPRDGQRYKTVKIGKYTWMNENLNFFIPDESWCYENNIDNCSKYGRIYTINALKNACPKGWGIDQNAWENLINCDYMKPHSLNKIASKGFDILLGGYRGDTIKVEGVNEGILFGWYKPSLKRFSFINELTGYWMFQRFATPTSSYDKPPFTPYYQAIVLFNRNEGHCDFVLYQVEKAGEITFVNDVGFYIRCVKEE